MESAPLAWLLSEIKSLLNDGMLAAAERISSTVTPIAATCFAIYMILITVNYVRGASSEPVWDFWLRMIGFAIIIGLGLNYTNYAKFVIPMVMEIGNDLAHAVTGASKNETPLDNITIKLMTALRESYDYARSLDFTDSIGAWITYAAKCTVVILTFGPVFAISTLYLALSIVGSTICAMLGPLYFAFLIFPATRQYFSAWVNTCFSYALIPVIVAVIVHIVAGVLEKLVNADPNLGFRSMLILALANLSMFAMLFYVSSLASSLSAGGINSAISVGGALSAAASGGRIGGKAAWGVTKTTGKGLYKGGKAIAAAIQRFRQNGIKPG
jgi:type IV secretion system protein VirB6